MIRCAMRMQKSQVTTTSWKWTVGPSTTWDKALYVMAGFTDYEAMVVGAAGGRSGVWGPGSSGSGSSMYYGAGGGGGSSKRVAGKLSDLSLSTSVLVGAKGANGVNGTTGATDGSRGGNSSFGATLIGYGGYGGKFGSDSRGPSIGGYGSNPDGSQGPVGGWSSGVDRNPAAGVWNNTTLEGSGAGGGGASWWQYGSRTYTAQAAQTGAVGSGYNAPGEGVQSTEYGGGGGGANVAPFTGGAAEYYGSGYMTANGNGVVLLRVS